MEKINIIVMGYFHPLSVLGFAYVLAVVLMAASVLCAIVFGLLLYKESKCNKKIFN